MKKQKSKNSSGPTRSWMGDIESNKYFTPAAFSVLAVALIVLFAEFLFSNKMLAGSDMLNAGIFFRSYLVDYVLSHGSIPQWNPYIFGGMPFVDAFHGDIFYPLSVMKFVGQLHRMLGLILVMHIFLAGIFMYFCARQFKLSKLPSVMAAAIYMFAPYLVSLVAPGHDGKIYVTTLFPVAFLFLERGFESKSWLHALFNFSMMGLGIGFIILSPHAQMSYFTLWALGAYTLYKLIRAYVENKAVMPLVRPASLAAFAVIIGLALSAIQFYPGYTYTTKFSPRADSKKGWDWATSWSMHEEEAFSLLIPEFSGVSATKEKTAYWGKNAFKDNSESVSVVAIFIALIGLFFGRVRHRFFMGGMAVITLLYGLGATTPLFKLFFYLVPNVSSLRAPSMIMFLFSFSISLLAGMGVQWLIESKAQSQESEKKFKYLLFGFPGLMLILAAAFGMNGRGILNSWTWLFFGDAGRAQVAQGVTKLDVAYTNLAAIQAGAWWAFLFVAAAALLIWMYRQGKMGMGLLAALVLIPVVNDIRFDKRFVETVDPQPYWNSNAVSDFFVRQPGQFRVMSFARVVSENFLPQFGISLVTGYHGNQLRWYDKLLGGPGAPEQANANLLNLAGAKYILVPANAQFPPGYFGDKPLTEAVNFGQARVLLNPNALPRAYLADQYRVIVDSNSMKEEVLRGPGDFRNVVYLQEEPIIELTPDSLSADSAWFVDYQADSIVIGLIVSTNKLLVLTDNDYESWHAYVDGQPSEILRAYGTFRAVEIPAGAKSVKFVYESEMDATGRIITLVTSFYLILVAGLFFGFRRRFEE
ncbi:MAG: hypothetical protein P1R58_04900 [bacterium]|nr:hypothetical protein [bacterium]